MKPGTHVMLVEDDAPMRRSLEKYLGGAGYIFESCSNAREAMLLADKRPYDIILVEYHLPDANGAVLLERLMRIMPGVSAIMISEYDYQAVAHSLVRANVRSYLKKPFDLVDLESALSSACSKVCFAMPEGEWNRELQLLGMPASLFK